MGLPTLDELLLIKPPMLWLDDIVAREPNALRCRLTLRSGQPFVDGAEVEALFTVEWMTQAASALAAVEARELGKPAVAHVLAALADARFHVASLALGDELHVTAERQPGGAFACSVSRHGQIVASAQLQLREHARSAG